MTDDALFREIREGLARAAAEGRTGTPWCVNQGRVPLRYA